MKENTCGIEALHDQRNEGCDKMAASRIAGSPDRKQNSAGLSGSGGHRPALQRLKTPAQGSSTQDGQRCCASGRGHELRIRHTLFSSLTASTSSQGVSPAGRLSSRDRGAPLGGVGSLSSRTQRSSDIESHVQQRQEQRIKAAGPGQLDSKHAQMLWVYCSLLYGPSAPDKAAAATQTTPTLLGAHASTPVATQSSSEAGAAQQCIPQPPPSTDAMSCTPDMRPAASSAGLDTCATPEDAHSCREHAAQGLQPGSEAMLEVERLRLTGNEVYNKRHFEHAAKLYTSALETLEACSHHSTSAACDYACKLLHNRAVAFMAQGDAKRALNDCNHILVIKPEDAWAMMRAAACHQRRGQLEHARVRLAQAAQLPKLSAAHKAACEQRTECLAQAIAFVDAAWKRLPECSPSEAASMAQTLVQHAQSDAGHSHLWLPAAAAALQAGHCSAAQSYAKHAYVAGDDDVRAQAWWLQVDSFFAAGKLRECADCISGRLQTLKAWYRTRNNATLSQHVVEHVRVALPEPAQAGQLVAAMQRAVAAKEQGNAAVSAKRFADAETLYTQALAEADVASPAFCATVFSNRAAASAVRT